MTVHTARAMLSWLVLRRGSSGAGLASSQAVGSAVTRSLPLSPLAAAAGSA